MTTFFLNCSLLRADVASATVLISMGALLGNTSYVQLIIMGFIEIVVFSANSYLGTKILKVSTRFFLIRGSHVGFFL